jgi:hypothetical protein
LVSRVADGDCRHVARLGGLTTWVLDKDAKASVADYMKKGPLVERSTGEQLIDELDRLGAQRG